jgi:hypothetical protein
MNELDNQLLAIYSLSAEPDDDHTDHAGDAVDIAFKIIEGSFARSDTNAVNSYLGRLDVKRTHARVLVGSLRASFRAKQALSNWYDLLVKTQAELDERGLNTNRLLSGLIQHGTIK